MTNCRFRGGHEKNAHLIKGFLSVCIFRKLVDYWIFFSFNMFSWLNSPVAYHPYLYVLVKPHFSPSLFCCFPIFLLCSLSLDRPASLSTALWHFNKVLVFLSCLTFGFSVLIELWMNKIYANIWNYNSSGFLLGPQKCHWEPLEHT